MVLIPTAFSPEKILIVEDDIELAQWTSDYLQGKGYQTQITTSGLEAVTLITKQVPDLVLLDGKLPDLDGLDVCRQVRLSYKGPIIMLTARDEEIDEVLGLEVGADDYITKPVRARALLARIRGLLRRHQSLANETVQPTNNNQISLAGLSIDKDKRLVELNNCQINITSNEFNMLWILASNAGEVVSREQLVKALRGFDYDGFDRSIDLKVSRLRKKLGDNPNEPYLIKTIWGKGYLLVRAQWDA
jgi:DNA-binding response OmpR family regulator